MPTVRIQEVQWIILQFVTTDNLLDDEKDNCFIFCFCMSLFML